MKPIPDMNKVDLLLKKQVDQHQTPAVQYMIFNRENILHKFKVGYADVINHKPIDWNTTFNGFSVTKTFTALAILQLAEKGHLDINNDASTYLPTFPYGPGITVKQLLAHSSGIPNPNPLNWIHLKSEHKNFDGKSFFNQVFNKNDKTRSKPNQKFSYSNLGYVLLGQIIESISGKECEDYIADNILLPISTTPEELYFEFSDDINQAKGYQKRYSLMNGILAFFMDKKKFMDKAEGKWKPFKNYYLNGSSYGGLKGNPDGFRKYIQELLKPDCKLISDEYKELLFTENYNNSGKATGMCLSWFKGNIDGHQYFAHAGGGGGYYCELRIYPQLNLGSVIMYNRSGMKDERFLDTLDSIYLEKL